MTDLPKPMVDVNGRPFLSYILEQCERPLLLTGYLGDAIHKAFLDVPQTRTPDDWSTGRRLWEARELLDDRFRLCYGDNFALARGSSTLTVVRKRPGNIDVSRGVAKCYTLRSNLHSFVEIGYMHLDKSMLRETNEAVYDTVRKLPAITAHVHEDVYCSVSDPERLEFARRYLAPKRLVLLDRDGVLNRKADPGCYVASPNDVTFLETNIRALAKLDCDFVVLTNQAGIGRRVVTRSSVDALHEWMARELKRRSVNVVDFLVCPHGWLDGCDCRKPKPGLFYQASLKYYLRLDKTLYIGDDDRDAEAAREAGCECLLLKLRSE